jgi:hypothetical protein
MRRAMLVLLLLGGSVAAAPKHKADAPKPTEDKGPAEGTGTHQEGDYGGVAPGHRPEKMKKVPKGTLAWIGFEAKNGGAEVFFQSVAPFELTQRVDNGVLVVNLTGLSKLGQNTWRPIDTRFFESPLSRISAKRSGKTRARAAGLEVRIAFKNAKDAKEGTLRTATEADGMYYAYLSFAGTPGSGGSMQEPEK